VSSISRAGTEEEERSAEEEESLKEGRRRDGFQS
jgi:hypothetical protein